MNYTHTHGQQNLRKPGVTLSRKTAFNPYMICGMQEQKSYKEVNSRAFHTSGLSHLMGKLGGW